MVDAVRWVLGEQRARQLRGARMDEVIFAGNNRRRPLGMAEVTLTYDNSDGQLATPFSEVALTRRAYRTGEGEYFINKSQVRLRDVIDLLLGTGLGPDASAIISQGEIDAILSAKPQARREVLEEVAGTSRYQARKHEAQRRLEATEANALRLADVVAELDRQVPAVEQQVRRARRFRKLSQRLRDLEILTYLRKTSARRGERAELAARLANEESERAASAARRAKLEANLQRARYEEYEATLAVDERGGERTEKAAALQEIAAALAAAQARFEETGKRCESLEREVDAAAKDVAGAEARVAAALAELAAAREERDRALAAVSKAALAEREAAAKWERGYESLRALEDRRAATAAQAAQSDAAAHAADAQLAQLADAITAATEELQATRARGQTERERAVALEREIQALTSAAVEHRKEFDQAQLERAAAIEQLKVARAASAAAHADAVHVAAQVEAQRMLESAADAAAGARAIQAAAKRGELPGIVGVLADLIEVDPAYATALDAALGATAHAIVARTAGDVQAAIAFLKTQQAGHATFLALDALADALAAARAASRGRPAAARLPGRPALEFVGCNSETRPVLDYLLADVAVVETLAEAMTVARSAPQQVVVTRDGERVRGAAIYAGAAAAGSGALAQRVELQALTDALAAKQAAARQAQAELGAAQQAHDRCLKRADAAAARQTEGVLRAKDAEAQLSMKLVETESLERRGVEIDERLKRLRAARDAAAKAAREHHRIGEQRGGANRSLEEQRGASAVQADRLQKELAELREGHRSASAHAAALVERVAQTGDDVERARQEVAVRRRAHEARADELARARDQAAQEQSTVKRLEAQRAEADAEVGRVQSEVDALRTRRDNLTARVRELDQEVGAAQANEREGSLELERRRIRLAEIDAELSVLQETFAQHPATEEECDDVATRHAAYDGDADVEIPKIRDILARLGDVNLNALEDQAKLRERRDFLRRQLDDLEQARKGILSSIAQIDAESLRRFNQVFEKVCAAFEETFAQLFDGGVARMWLQTDVADPTEAGVEIAAQPPGKKMQSLSLLSGGERALTAAALVFAIVKVRPSPFYFFDEIDAALDEANIGRFGGMLTELASRAQIIMITHNKATMTLADRIYGVTMGEPGVSNVLSLALEQIGA